VLQIRLTIVLAARSRHTRQIDAEFNARCAVSKAEAWAGVRFPLDRGVWFEPADGNASAAASFETATGIVGATNGVVAAASSPPALH